MLRIISGLVFAFTTFSFVWSQSDRPWLKYMPPQYLNDPNREYYENYYRNWYMQNQAQLQGQAPGRQNSYDRPNQGYNFPAEQRYRRRPSSIYHGGELKNRDEALEKRMALDDQFLEQAANVRRDIDKYYLEGNLSFAMNSREFKVDGSSSTSKTETTEFMLESKLGFSTFLENAHIGPVLGIRSVSNDDAKSSEFEFYGGGFIDYFFYDQDMFRVGGGLDLLLIYASTTTGSGTSVESSNTGFGFGAFPNLVALVDVFEGRAHLVGRLGYEIASVTLSNDSSSGGSSAKTTVSDGNIVFKVGLATSF